MEVNVCQPKAIKTKEGKYQCPESMEVYPIKKDYGDHCVEKHPKTKN
jgi:hypothetical protein